MVPARRFAAALAALALAAQPVLAEAPRLVPASDDPGKLQRLAGITALVAGGGALVLAGYFGLEARSGADELDAFYKTGGTWNEDRAALERSVTANNARAISLAVVGGLVVGAGGVLLFLGSRKRDGVTVQPSDGGAAVVWSGSF